MYKNYNVDLMLWKSDTAGSNLVFLLSIPETQ